MVQSTFNARETAAVLAGLRLLQCHADDGYENPEILDVADDLGTQEPLTAEEIEALCARFNAPDVTDWRAGVVVEVKQSSPANIAYVRHNGDYWTLRTDRGINLAFTYDFKDSEILQAKLAAARTPQAVLAACQRHAGHARTCRLIDLGEA